MEGPRKPKGRAPPPEEAEPGPVLIPHQEMTEEDGSSAAGRIGYQEPAVPNLSFEPPMGSPAISARRLALTCSRITCSALSPSFSRISSRTRWCLRSDCRAVPDCRAEVIPQARHMLPVERPEAFVDSLTTFIGECAHV
ncbi:hypothetical protein SAURM35S_06144 [Streptomyces aurantiogriseus]